MRGRDETTPRLHVQTPQGPPSRAAQGVGPRPVRKLPGALPRVPPEGCPRPARKLTGRLPRVPPQGGRDETTPRLPGRPPRGLRGLRGLWPLAPGPRSSRRRSPKRTAARQGGTPRHRGRPQGTRRPWIPEGHARMPVVRRSRTPVSRRSRALRRRFLLQPPRDGEGPRQGTSSKPARTGPATTLTLGRSRRGRPRDPAVAPLPPPPDERRTNPECRCSKHPRPDSVATSASARRTSDPGSPRARCRVAPPPTERALPVGTRVYRASWSRGDVGTARSARGSGGSRSGRRRRSWWPRPPGAYWGTGAPPSAGLAPLLRGRLLPPKSRMWTSWRPELRGRRQRSSFWGRRQRRSPKSWERSPARRQCPRHATNGAQRPPRSRGNLASVTRDARAGRIPIRQDGHFASTLV